jgi:hypothetical protein
MVLKSFLKWTTPNLIAALNVEMFELLSIIIIDISIEMFELINYYINAMRT